MYKQCRTEQSTNRQRDMEQGLLQMMLRQQFEEISVSSLCSRIGIPRKSFYRYFDSKEGALYALIDHTLMNWNLTNITNYQESVPLRYMEQVFSYWIQQKPLLDALERSGLSGLLVQRSLEYTGELNTVPNFMQIREKRLREYGTMFTVCGLMSMIVRWHHDGFPNSVEEMSRLAMQLFSQPLFTGAWSTE